MITMEEKDMIPNRAIIFISDDEPLYKYASIFIAMLKKFYTTGYDPTDLSSAIHTKTGLKGNRIKFYKGNHGVFSKSFLTIGNSNNLSLKITSLSNYVNFTYIKEFHETLDQNLCYKYTKNMPINYNLNTKLECDLSFPTNLLLFNPELRDESIADEKKVDNNINKLIFFEENQKFTKTFCFLASFLRDKAIFKIGLKEFSKLNKYSSFLNNIDIPTKESRNQFLDLCSLIKKSKTLSILKVNFLTFYKQYDHLEIKFLGLPLIHEKTFGRFNYLDHPSINFLSDFLNKTSLLNLVEARISKEILTSI